MAGHKKKIIARDYKSNPHSELETESTATSGSDRTQQSDDETDDSLAPSVASPTGSQEQKGVGTMENVRSEASEAVASAAPLGASVGSGRPNYIQSDDDDYEEDDAAAPEGEPVDPSTVANSGTRPRSPPLSNHFPEGAVTTVALFTRNEVSGLQLPHLLHSCPTVNVSALSKSAREGISTTFITLSSAQIDEMWKGACSLFASAPTADAQNGVWLSMNGVMVKEYGYNDQKADIDADGNIRGTVAFVHVKQRELGEFKVVGHFASKARGEPIPVTDEEDGSFKLFYSLKPDCSELLEALTNDSELKAYLAEPEQREVRKFIKEVTYPIALRRYSYGKKSKCCAMNLSTAVSPAHLMHLLQQFGTILRTRRMLNGDCEVVCGSIEICDRVVAALWGAPCMGSRLFFY